MNIGFDVFTPTYNRAYCIKNVYESLLQQTWSNFTWVVIDDGSKDDTKELIQKFIEEGKIDIIYHWQENQGRFAAYNSAKHFFKHELIATVDSDDWLLPDGLEKIHRCWESLNNKSDYSGIVAHFETQDGKLLGTEFPWGVEAEKIYVLYDRDRIKGDKFIVTRNDLVQKYNYPIYRGEKFGGDSLVFNWIDDDYPHYILHDKVAHRDYLSDSITNNLMKHHLMSPNGMTDHYNELIRVEKYNKNNKLKHSIAYIAYGLLSGRGYSRVMCESNCRALTNLLIIPGTMYYVWLRKMKGRIETDSRYRSQ